MPDFTKITIIFIIHALIFYFTGLYGIIDRFPNSILFAYILWFYLIGIYLVRKKDKKQKRD
ncbi:hypothetical protein BFS06_12345 [Clostridium perfringens]|uniref:Uncharacterized protein n=1 Tax=Clostridium perfringens TaxID=1502 RepID=A0A140GR36_CLOPF|nr:hypothetical protein JFP838_pA0079 [Clostridium perfringens]TBX14991.1 hypothetical protein BFS06_12345 [Clostridium perfringens]